MNRPVIDLRLPVAVLITYHFKLLGLREMQQLVLPCNARVAIEPVHDKSISLSKQASLASTNQSLDQVCF